MEFGYVDDRTEEEKQRNGKRMRKAIEANKRIYAYSLDESDSLNGFQLFLDATKGQGKSRKREV